MSNHHSACENEAVSMSGLVCSPSRAGAVELMVVLWTTASMMGCPVYCSPSPVAEIPDWLRGISLGDSET